MNRTAKITQLLALSVLLSFFIWEIAYSGQSQKVPIEPDSLDDGPHVYWQNDSTAVVIYFQDREFVRTEYPFQANLSFEKVAGNDTTIYRMAPRNNHSEPETFSGVSRILAISDIHGEYEYLVDLLRNTKVIDDNNHWSWGDGHLVIVGDVFDRGNMVTECLWLIYQLELEAKAAGGAVHYLLGNHEHMVMTNDLRYVNDKYLNGISRRNRINYSELFGPNMELGRWLRTKHTVIKLNDIIFVHGGLSSELIDSGYSITEINNRVRVLLDLPAQESMFNQRSLFLTKGLGPLWYRGFHYDMENSYDQATTAQVERVLEYFNAHAIVVGHTGVDSVMSLYDSRVFAVDIPFEDIHSLEALLCNDSGFFRVMGSGELRPLKLK